MTKLFYQIGHKQAGSLELPAANLLSGIGYHALSDGQVLAYRLHHSFFLKYSNDQIKWLVQKDGAHPHLFQKAGQDLQWVPIKFVMLHTMRAETIRLYQVFYLSYLAGMYATTNDKTTFERLTWFTPVNGTATFPFSGKYEEFANDYKLFYNSANKITKVSGLWKSELVGIVTLQKQANAVYSRMTASAATNRLRTSLPSRETTGKWQRMR